MEKSKLPFKSRILGTIEVKPIGIYEHAEHAGFGIRALAFILDYLFIFIVSLCFGLIVRVFQIPWIFQWSEKYDTLYVWILIVFYFTIFTSIYSATPGKLICGLKVIEFNGYSPIGFLKAFSRSFCYLISSFIFGLGFWWVIWDRHKQAWHDKIVQTRVIKTKKKAEKITDLSEKTKIDSKVVVPESPVKLPVGHSCPRCNQKFASEKYCPNCGEKIIHSCSGCGTEVEPSQSFCSGCGAQMECV